MNTQEDHLREGSPDRTKSLLDLSPERKFQVALALFQNQAEVIRALKENDLQVVGGFMTLQLVLAAWLVDHPPMTSWGKGGLLGLSIILAFLSSTFLYNNHCRRKQVVESLGSTKMALRLGEQDIYVSGSALDVQTIFRPSFWLYISAFALTIVGVGAVILWGGS